MNTYSLPYGSRSIHFQIPGEVRTDEIALTDVPGIEDPAQEVERALRETSGGVSLADFPGIRSAAIAINDKTRPVPHEYLLPPLLHRLEILGLNPQAISLWVATGTHSPMAPDEFPKILPSNIIERYPVISHDADDQTNLINLGETSRGTPVWINKRYMQADLRIVVGNIEPHHFMGFSGGVKSAVIGLAGRETINKNHALLSHPDARTGVYAENPMRQDIEEMGKLARVDFALNAILNAQKELVWAVSGEPYAVMQMGVPLSRDICQVPVPALYDLVIASPGGHPKDINFYQTQKGLTHAAMLTRDGGVVVLVAACPEGVGSEDYLQWMEGMTSFTQVTTRFREEGFQVGPHKAFMVARDASRVKVVLVSEMHPETVKKLLITPAASVEAAIGIALKNLPSPVRAAILPLATITVPQLPGRSS